MFVEGWELRLLGCYSSMLEPVGASWHLGRIGSPNHGIVFEFSTFPVFPMGHLPEIGNLLWEISVFFATAADFVQEDEEVDEDFAFPPALVHLFGECCVVIPSGHQTWLDNGRNQ